MTGLLSGWVGSVVRRKNKYSISLPMTVLYEDNKEDNNTQTALIATVAVKYLKVLNP